MSTFPGFTSRCTNPAAWATSSAPATCPMIESACFSSRALLAEQRAKIGARHIAHGDEQLSSRLARLVNGDHVRVIDGCRNLTRARTAPGKCVLAEPGGELERHLAPQPEVLGDVTTPIPPRARTTDPIAAELGSGRELARGSGLGRRRRRRRQLEGRVLLEDLLVQAPEFGRGARCRALRPAPPAPAGSSRAPALPAGTVEGQHSCAQDAFAGCCSIRPRAGRRPPYVVPMPAPRRSGARSPTGVASRRAISPRREGSAASRRAGAPASASASSASPPRRGDRPEAGRAPPRGGLRSDGRRPPRLGAKQIAARPALDPALAQRSAETRDVAR